MGRRPSVTLPTGGEMFRSTVSPNGKKGKGAYIPMEAKYAGRRVIVIVLGDGKNDR